MNPDETLPPVPPSSGPAPAGGEPAGDAWPASGPAKGFRIKLPVAIVAAVVIGLAGAAAGASLKKTPASSTSQSGAVANRPRNFGGASGTGTGANGANGAGRSGPGG